MNIFLDMGDIYEICEIVIKRMNEDNSYIKFLLNDFKEYLKSEGIASMYNKIEFDIPDPYNLDFFMELF